MEINGNKKKTIRPVEKGEVIVQLLQTPRQQLIWNP